MENLQPLPHTSIRTLFHTPSLISPFDDVHSTTDGLHAIGRPIDANFSIQPNYSNFPNRFFSNSSPQSYHLCNNLSYRRARIEGSEGLANLDSSQQAPQLPLEPIEPLLTITHIGEEENLERGIRVQPQRGTPPNSPTSDPPTPPTPSDFGEEEPEEMAQPPKLLNIAPFPYFYGRPGDDLDAYKDRFLIVAAANELPQNKEEAYVMG